MNVIGSTFDSTTHKYTKPTFEVANKELHMTYLNK
jgi:hypothetical protein